MKKFTREYAEQIALHQWDKVGYTLEDSPHSTYIQGVIFGYMIAIEETNAPELLEALRKIRNDIQYEQGLNVLKKSGKNWAKEIALINNAINKATL